MKKYLFLVALGVACGGGTHAYDDDDDSSNHAGNKSGGSAGRGGSASGGRAGTSTSSAGRGGAGGTVSASGGMSTGGSSLGGAAVVGGTSGSAGSAGTSGTSSGGQGAVSQGGGTSQGGAGEGGISADAGAGGESAGGGTGGTGGTTGGTGGTTGGTGGTTGGTGGSTGGTGGTTGGTGGTTGGTGGSTGGVGGTGQSGSSHSAGGPDGGVGGVSDASDQPLVELVIDGSSSMFEDSLWDEVYASLVTDGVLDSFESKLDLGLAVYQGRVAASVSESDPTCAIMTSVGFAGDNAGEIGTAITAVGNAYVVGTKYETPTNFAVHTATATLGGVTVPSGVKKYILLVTDGAPNTCLVHDPQCGQDASVAAVEDARTAGIRTLVVGLGDLLTADDGCPTYARCGEDHLQDIANAGVGYPVEPPNSNYRFLPCTPTNTLAADYTTTGNGGSAVYYAASNPAGLTSQLTAALQSIVDGTVP